jgi:hypothetical protein
MCGDNNMDQHLPVQSAVLSVWAVLLVSAVLTVWAVLACFWGGRSKVLCAVQVEPLLKAGKNVLISAHGNSLRAIIMYLDSLTSEQVRACTPGFPTAVHQKSSTELDSVANSVIKSRCAPGPHWVWPRRKRNP